MLELVGRRSKEKKAFLRWLAKQGKDKLKKSQRKERKNQRKTLFPRDCVVDLPLGVSSQVLFFPLVRKKKKKETMRCPLLVEKKERKKLLVT